MRRLAAPNRGMGMAVAIATAATTTLLFALGVAVIGIAGAIVPRRGRTEGSTSNDGPALVLVVVGLIGRALQAVLRPRRP